MSSDSIVSPKDFACRSIEVRAARASAVSMQVAVTVPDMPSAFRSAVSFLARSRSSSGQSTSAWNLGPTGMGTSAGRLSPPYTASSMSCRSMPWASARRARTSSKGGSWVLKASTVADVPVIRWSFSSFVARGVHDRRRRCPSG